MCKVSTRKTRPYRARSKVPSLFTFQLCSFGKNFHPGCALGAPAKGRLIFVEQIFHRLFIKIIDPVCSVPLSVPPGVWNRHSTRQFACLLCLCPVSSPGIMRLSKRNCNVAKVINSTITHCHKFHQPVRTDLWGMIVFASAARCSYSVHPSIGSGLQWRCAL